MMHGETQINFNNVF